MKHMRRKAVVPVVAAMVGLGLLTGCGSPKPAGAGSGSAPVATRAAEGESPGRAAEVSRELTETEKLDLAQLVKMVSRAVAYTYDSEPPAGDILQAAQGDPEALGNLMSNACYLQAERLKADPQVTDAYADVYGISWVSNGDSILMPTREVEKLMTSCFGAVPTCLEDVGNRRIIKGEGGWTIYPSNTYTRETVQLGTVNATASRVEFDISITYIDSGQNAADERGEGSAEFTYHVVAVPDEQSVYGFHLVEMRSTGHTVLGGFTVPEDGSPDYVVLEYARQALLYYGEMGEDDQIVVGRVSANTLYISVNGKHYIVDREYYRVLDGDGNPLQ